MHIERVVCREHWKTCHHEMPTLITLCSLILSPCTRCQTGHTHMRYEERLVMYGLVQELAGGQYGGIESEYINSLSNMSANLAALPSGASRSCTIVSAPESRCSVHMVSCGREGEGRHLPPPEICVPSLDEQAVHRLFTCTIIHCLLSLQFCSINFAPPPPPPPPPPQI